jgi:hypothetical protein
MEILWLQKRPEPVCGCNYFACVIATRSYLWLQHDWVCVVTTAWLFMIASLSSVWLQTAGSFCDCKLFVCVSLQTLLVILWLQKNPEPVYDYNYFACVIATRSYLWLHHDWVCVVKATWFFGYLWLQAWVVCDCKQHVRLWLQKLFCVCHCKNCWLFYYCKKRTEQCVLQLFCVRDCYQKLSVVAKPDCVCVVKKLLGYLVYDCKPE